METWFPKTKQLLFRLLDPSIHFFQGFSEDLPHHTARIFAQARVASWAWHEMTKLSLKSNLVLYKMGETLS